MGLAFFSESLSVGAQGLPPALPYCCVWARASFSTGAHLALTGTFMAAAALAAPFFLWFLGPDAVWAGPGVSLVSKRKRTGTYPVL
jgi:hypothetical protein